MKRNILVLVIVLSTCILPVFGQKMTREQYVEKYWKMAVAEMEYSGIPASITLAQGCLETGNGNSTLAKNANNHFGIKCHGWKGESILKDDDKPNECFRKYDDAAESFRDHSDFLRGRDRYASLFALDPTDYKGWAYGLKKAGYATDPKYAQSLIDIIEENELYRYDTKLEPEDLPPTPMEAETIIALKPESGHKLYTASLARQILSTNGVAYIIAQPGDSFREIAKEYSLFKRELLNYNDLGRKATLSPGDIVYLEGKRRESARNLNSHVVEEGETMRSIAQRFAVKVKYLYKYNDMAPGSEPEPGAILKLRKR